MENVLLHFFTHFFITCFIRSNNDKREFKCTNIRIFLKGEIFRGKDKSK